MDTLAQLAAGFAVALTPYNLMWCLVGVTVGTAIGVLPGLGPALTIALLLPLTYKVDATAAFILFAGIYYGAMYGGSTTSILLNTPGESATIVTALEGNKMARRGRAGAALATAAIGSFVAGTIGTIGITFLAEPVVNFALKFGPAEYFSLMVLAFVTVSAVLGNSAVRGLVSLAVGIFLGLIGIDLQTGQPRFTFGLTELLDGINVIVVAVGLFAVGETLYLACFKRQADGEVLAVKDSIWMSREDWARSWKPWLRGSAIGFPIGAMPAGGAEVPTFLSYFIEKRLSQKPEEFGHGAIEGVAGPEAANNASAAGVLVPMLALGLPTSATAAIMLSAFQSYGIKPGPLLLQQQSALVWGLIASLYIGNVMLLVLNLPLVGPVGEDAEDPRAAALWRHPGVRHHRHLRHQPVAGRPGPALPDGHHGPVHAPLRFPDRAGHHRHDPGAARRAGVPPRHDHQPGRHDDLPAEAAVAGAASACPGGGAWTAAVAPEISAVVVDRK